MDTSEITRRKDFCQFRSKIRHSDSHLIVGIDIAKDKHNAFLGTANGKTFLRRHIFTNNAQGFASLLLKAESCRIRNNLSDVVFGLEPTGNYHKPLAAWLLKKGLPLVMVSGKAVKDNRELLDGRWDKNDRKDSANIADLIAQGKMQFFENPSSNIIQLRELLSLLKALKKDQFRLKMRIRNGLIAKFFPELDQYLGQSHKENLAIIKQYVDPHKIAATDFKTFLRDVTTTDKGIRQIQRLKKIHDAADHSIGIPVSKSTEFEAKILTERIIEVAGMINETMAEIKKLCQQMDAYPFLLTIPGFGPYVSSLALSVIGDPFRFENRKQIIRLAGLDLNAKRSGKTSISMIPVISKRGNPHLRYALFQAAVIASSRNDVFQILFNRMLKGREKERGIKMKMRVKLAAKLLLIAWTIMKTKEPFNPELIIDIRDVR